jgi:DNA segregation ATPase FtsK/SpoIIIE, S-DNA-T family
MGTTVVHRAPRRPAPPLPAGDLAVPAPPPIPEVVGSRWQHLVQMVPLVAGTVATALLFAGRSGDRYSLVIGAIFGLSTLGMLLTSWPGAGGQAKKAELVAARRDYLRRLAALRRRVRGTVARQRHALHYRHPDPRQLWSTVDSYRLWERRPGDGDFLVARVGLGPQTLATALVPPVTADPADLEPVTAGALRDFLDAYSVVPDLPVAVALRGFARVYVRGGDDAAAGLVRALLAQLVTFHAPDDLLIAVCPAVARRAEWELVKWLPHAMHPTRVDGAGPVRLLATTAAELERRLADVIGGRSPRPADVSDGRSARVAAAGAATPHVLVVLDGGDLSGAQHLGPDRAVDGVTVIDLGDPPPRLLDRTAIALTVEAGALRIATLADPAPVRAPDAPDPVDGPGTPDAPHPIGAPDAPHPIGAPDALSPVEFEALARRLAPRRLAGPGGDDTPARVEPAFADLLGLGDPAAFDVARAAAPRPQRARLRVPIGVGADGRPVELDLKESAQDGMGPHGLVIGATGSGKSELLRTLVIGLAATHSSESLNFVLIDYKGGATFVSLDRLPHVAAVITNLADELTLVDRMSDAINGEVLRRQALLRGAGNYASIHDYERARSGGAPLAPLPTLLIVCDEFSELLTAKPDFIELFVQIGRVGRSLGVHLLLASQRLEEGRLRGLDTHLSYRLGLRTFSALESRAVLGVPDAYELPRAPGHGYLKYGTEPLVRFRAAYVSGPATPAGAVAPPAPAVRPPVLDYTTHDVPVPRAAAPSGRPAPAGSTSLLDLLVGRLSGHGAPAHQVWLPPLGAAASLDELLGPVRPDPVRGLTTVDAALHGKLRVPVGLIDKPLEQRRDPLWLRLSAEAGHVAIAGSARSGKSTLLRTLIAALALTHTPAEVQVYCLDFGGGVLTGVGDLPHVGAVVGRQDTAAVRRTVAEVTGVLARRERHGRGSDRHGDVFLVIDGWSTLRKDYDDLEFTITDVATRGLAYGIHVVAAAMRWNDFRPSIRDLFGTRLELRLGDPSDSEVDRRLAADVPRTPGRGLTADRMHFLAARPVLGGGSADPADLVKAVRNAWPGPVAPRVRLLPDRLPRAEVAGAWRDSHPLALPIGVAEDDLQPVLLDVAAEPHLLLFGDAECGKTTFLRALARTVMDRFAPEQARIMVVDYRRGLLGAVTGEHVIGYGTDAQRAATLVESAAGYMQRRLPGPDVTADQLRSRSWWTGPELFLLVDDYDLVCAGAANPILPMLDHLAHARDIGLHVVLTRRTGGAARALYEPVVQRIRELSGPVLVMSGDRDEGPLVGNVRPGPLPPGRAWLVTRRDGVRLVQLADEPDSG